MTLALERLCSICTKRARLGMLSLLTERCDYSYRAGVEMISRAVLLQCGSKQPQRLAQSKV